MRRDHVRAAVSDRRRVDRQFVGSAVRSPVASTVMNPFHADRPRLAGASERRSSLHPFDTTSARLPVDAGEPVDRSSYDRRSRRDGRDPTSANRTGVGRLVGADGGTVEDTEVPASISVVCSPSDGDGNIPWTAASDHPLEYRQASLRSNVRVPEGSAAVPCGRKGTHRWPATIV